MKRYGTNSAKTQRARHGGLSAASGRIRTQHIPPRSPAPDPVSFFWHPFGSSAVAAPEDDATRGFARPALRPVCLCRGCEATVKPTTVALVTPENSGKQLNHVAVVVIAAGSSRGFLPAALETYVVFAACQIGSFRKNERFSQSALAAGRTADSDARRITPHLRASALRAGLPRPRGSPDPTPKKEERPAKGCLSFAGLECG
jgi:hypothetical protein